jgi:hypothetical protein
MLLQHQHAASARRLAGFPTFWLSPLLCASPLDCTLLIPIMRALLKLKLNSEH